MTTDTVLESEFGRLVDQCGSLYLHWVVTLA